VSKLRCGLSPAQSFKAYDSLAAESTVGYGSQRLTTAIVGIEA